MLILAVAVCAMAFGSRSSSAGTFGQVLLAKATAMIGAGASLTSAHTLDADVAEEPAESSNLATARRGHTATRLQDGRVLIAGGADASGALNGTEVFDPATGTFSASGNMGAARVDHSATLLPDGRVLIAGGSDSSGSLSTTEIFDPATGTFAAGPSLSVARAGHSATLFADGRIFIAGGDANGSAELVSASLSGSSLVGAMSGARSMHSAALMQDGRVLIVGGRDGNGNALATGEIFGDGFSTIETTLKLARVRPHLRVLFDGKVQVIGGNNDRSMEIYDPAEGIFGAYAHVLPESDPCTGLHNQVLGSQTRAALFHTGAADELFDRSGHTITELGGEALVVGGANGAGAVLGSSSVVTSSSAAISTDKMDYAPGQTATISGRGYQAGEVVRVKIHEDPHTPQERGFDVTADGDGNFSGEYLVMDYDLDMKFIVGARGLTSGRTAQTTFTDANPQTILVAAPTSATVLQGATATYGNVTVVVGGNTNPCTVTLGVTPALPAGAAAVFGTNPNNTTGANIVTSLSVTTSASTPAGTYTFQVTGTNGAGCQGPGPVASNTLTLIVNAATVNTTTTVANATATYGDASVTLNATVTPASGPAVNSGSVTFTVKQGPTTIGVATTDTTVVAGAASVSYALPAGTVAGPYTIEASYSGATGFNASAGTGTLTINKKELTITAADKTKTYGDAVVFDETTPSVDFSVVGLVNSDTVASITLTSAGAAATATVAGSPYAIIPSDAVGTGLTNYDIAYVNGSLTVEARDLTITASDKTKTYGDTVVFDETTPSGDFSVVGLVNADTVASITLTSTGAPATATVAGSPYTIVPSNAVGTGLANYDIAYVNGSLTVDPKALTIT
ncbi:MAG TPA: kelch repeat-containing protein, partial [Pyrinomonadaceae bacterium]|nr:kelch repeat-containing protein [Pyrinomonadaceae bacterium]